MVGNSFGKKKWFFPDGYLPDPEENPVGPSHESVCILNPSERKATVDVTIYFEDQDPIEDVRLEIGSHRDIHFRLDRFEEYSGVALPTNTPYGLQIISNVNVICQLSRMDTRNDNLSLFTTTGYWED